MDDEETRRAKAEQVARAAPETIKANAKARLTAANLSRVVEKFAFGGM